MTDDFAAAVIAFWSYHMDCALKTVEDMGFLFEPDLERLVVFVSTMFTLSHKFCSLRFVLAQFHFTCVNNEIMI